MSRKKKHSNAVKVIRVIKGDSSIEITYKNKLDIENGLGAGIELYNQMNSIRDNKIGFANSNHGE